MWYQVPYTLLRLAFESLKYFQHWKEMVGGDCGFQPLGLLVFTLPEYPAHLEANIAMMRRVGVNTRTISPQDAQELDPSLWAGDVTGVAYEPESGYADPNATIYSLARASADLGVTFQFETRDYIDACRQQLFRRFPIMRQSVVRGNWGCMRMHIVKFLSLPSNGQPNSPFNEVRS